ncbi:hypothetical protein OBBRIDRAFT_238022 [Obba rivulosa]|uniref:Uncharacterized protein n=1 Tax=Obba rivulosa TaxID=1052685 RepID=A0A8E2DQP0_9APHY|nr:hypothetical protein OBBRIDRAFT_238022 [Obba rivulosa]
MRGLSLPSPTTRSACAALAAQNHKPRLPMPQIPDHRLVTMQLRRTFRRQYWSGESITVASHFFHDTYPTSTALTSNGMILSSNRKMQSVLGVFTHDGLNTTLRTGRVRKCALRDTRMCNPKFTSSGDSMTSTSVQRSICVWTVTHLETSNL